MQHVLSSLPLSADLGSNPVFNVLIAYQDFDTGREAKKIYDFISSNVGEECRCENQMWKFDVFAIPKLREMATRDALAADIIIVAGRPGELPVEVKNWVESWLWEQPSALALVALYDESEGDPNPDETARGQCYLEEAARRGGMEFFLHKYSSSDRRTGGARGLMEMPFAFRSMTPNLAGQSREHILQRWGINE